MENLKSITIFLLTIFVVMLSIDRRSLSNSNKQLERLYNDTNSINDSLFKFNARLLKEISIIDEASWKMDKEIDSLQSIIDNNKIKPCGEELALYKAQNTALKKALELQKEARGIEGIVTSNLHTINVNNEVVLVKCMKQIDRYETEDKKAKIWRWVERVGWVAIIVIILA